MRVARVSYYKTISFIYVWMWVLYMVGVILSHVYGWVLDKQV